MAFESETDRLAYLEAFGDQTDVDGRKVYGLLDRAFIEVLEVGGYRPVLTCRASDIAGVAKGAPVTASGQDFMVIQLQPDGTGLVDLVLRES